MVLEVQCTLIRFAVATLRNRGRQWLHFRVRTFSAQFLVPAQTF